MALSVVGAILTLAVIAYGGVVGVQAATHRPQSPKPVSNPSCGWSIAPSPNVGAAMEANELHAISVLADDDAWAVGYHYAFSPGEGGGGPNLPLIEHWDGTAWNVVAAPDIPTGTLAGVVAVATDDAWAVGSKSAAGGADVPLILHWDGSMWREMPAPDVGKRYARLLAVAAYGSEDVYAVGNWATGEVGGTLAMRWDGRSWSILASLDPPPDPLLGHPYPGLGGVAAPALSEVWAVGTRSNVAPAIGSNPLVERYDGAEWTVASAPDVPAQTGPTTDELTAVAARSATDAWAVGSYAIDATNPVLTEPLVLHWDGSSWTAVAAEPLPASGGLDGVAIGSGPASNDVWAVGSFRSGLDLRPAVEGWDGETWTLEPGVPDAAGWLGAVATAPSGEIWSVGSTAVSDQPSRTLVLRGTCPSGA